MPASPNKNPPAPQQPLNSTREIKQVRNATLDDLFAILKELFSLKYQQLVDPSNDYKIQLRNITNSAIDLRAAFDYSTIYGLYQKISDDPAAVRYYLFPADILNIAVEVMEIVADEATKRISTKGDSSQLSTLLDEIAQSHSDDLKKAKASRSQWRGYPQITHTQEHDFAVKQRNGGFKLLSQLTSSAFEHHKQLRGLFDRAYLEQVAGSKDASLKPDYSEFAKSDVFKNIVLANGQTVEQVAEGEGTMATETPKEVAKQVPEDVKMAASIPKKTAEKNIKDEQQLVTKAEESPDEYQVAKNQLAAQIAQLATQVIVTNYTLTNNSSTLLQVDQMDEELKRTLLRDLAQPIGKLIENLTPSELMALVDNREGASTVRLKILRQAHEFMLSSPQVHFLMQSAIDLHYQSLADNPEAQKALAEKIKATTHRDVVESLAQIAEDKKSLDISAEDTLKDAYSILEEKNTWHYGGEQELLRRLKTAGIEIESHELIALNELFASMIVTSPQMSGDFFEFLDRSRMNLFLASKISPDASDEQIKQLQKLLSRYFEVYRAKANNRHQSLEQLSASFPDQQPTQEGVDKTLEIAGHFRKDFIQRTGVTHDEAVALMAGEVDENDPKLVSLSGEVQDQLEGGAWVGMPLGHKIEFLRRSGLGEKILKSIQDDFTAQEVLKQYNIQLDIFQMYQVQMEAAQQIAVAQLQAKQLLAAATLSEFQTQQQTQQLQAMMMGNRLFVPGEELSDIDPSFGAYSPTQSADQAVASSEQLGQHVGDQRNQLLEGLASKGVAAALVAAGVPAPLASAMAGIVTSQLMQQAQQINKLLKQIVPLLIGAIGALLAMIGKLMATLGTAAASALMAGGGFALLGPPGLLLGGIPLVANALSGAAATTGSAVGSTAANQLTRATQAAQPSLAEAGANFRSATSDLLGNIANNIKSAFSKEALSNTLGIGATGSGPLATTLTATATALPMVASVLTMTVVISSFLIDLSGKKASVTPDLSRFVNISKTASIVESPDCDGKSQCSTPTFPMTVEYAVVIEPKDDYTIEIKSFLDESVVYYNKKKYQEIGLSVPNASVSVKHANDVNLTVPTVLSTTDEDPDNDRLELVYRVLYNDAFNHASIKNKAKIEFAYSNDQEQGNDFASGVAITGFGDYPQALLCWPMSGKIVQGPWGSFSHSIVDAYDLIPLKASDYTLYAPVDGTICPGRVRGAPGNVYDSTYGYHVSITANIAGEVAVLVFGHMVEEPDVVKAGCQPIRVGDRIGTVGSTGWSKGAHLHFELRSGTKFNLTELMTGSPSPYVLNETIVQSCADEGY